LFAVFKGGDGHPSVGCRSLQDECQPALNIVQACELPWPLRSGDDVVGEREKRLELRRRPVRHGISLNHDRNASCACELRCFERRSWVARVKVKQDWVLASRQPPRLVSDVLSRERLIGRDACGMHERACALGDNNHAAPGGRSWLAFR
jgi:hypothetical protein